MRCRNFLVVFAALTLFPLAAAVAARVPGALAPFDVHEITSEVHVLGTPEDYYGPAISNITIIEQSDGFVVVDSGLTAGNGRTIVAYIKDRSQKPVKAVIVTHWHNDHPQGVSAIRDAWPRVRIIATEETKQGMLGPELGPLVGLAPSNVHLAEMQKLVNDRIASLDKQIAEASLPTDQREQATKSRADFRRFLLGYAGTYVVPPTETFEHRLILYDPRAPVEVLFLGRANTAGDAIVWLPNQRIVATGDVVVWPVPFGFYSFPADWVKTIQKIKALRYSTLVPGHGKPQTGTQYVDQLVGSIEDLRAQVGPLARAGLSLEEVRARVKSSRHSEFFGTNERRKKLFKAYWVEPMVENVWKEARGIPIVQGEGEVTVKEQSERARK